MAAVEELPPLSKSSQLNGTIAPSEMAEPIKNYLLYSCSEGMLDIRLSYEETYHTREKLVRVRIICWRRKILGS